jgi:signal transduction histidine kinase
VSSSNPLKELEGLQAGSLLRVTGLCRLELGRSGSDWEPACPWCGGVCRIDSDKRQNKARLHLWVASASDVHGLRRPRPSLALVGFVLAGACLAMVLGVGYRARRRRLDVERALQSQVALQEELRQNEQQLRRSMQERERIGQDLHDDIIQSIYSVGLGLEDVRRLMRRSSDEADSRLGFVINSLNEVIRSVRSFIAGLEPRLLSGRELKPALKSLALTTGETQCQYSFEIDSVAANNLTAEQSTQLFHIAKEAISNSLRHAQASRIVVELRKVERGAELEVRDDGVGFRPELERQRGQGLRNISQRVQSLGGTLQVHSSPGSGTRVAVLIPS